MSTTTVRGRWAIDSASSQLEFAVRHVGILRVRGRFTEVEAQATDDGAGQLTQGSARIGAASISTRNARRDADLRRRFLAAETHPDIVFAITGPASLDRRIWLGTLRLRGVSRPIAIAVEPALDAQTGTLRIRCRAWIDRRQFGVRTSGPIEWLGFVVGRKVHVTADIVMREAVDSDAIGAGAGR